MEKVVDYGYIKQTYTALLRRFENKIGVAAIMGNFYAESKIVPYCKQGNVVPPWTTSEQYTEKINKGSYTKEQYMNDGIGYSFPQWTFPARKGNLWDFWKASGARSIGDLYGVVLPFFFQEMSGYSELDKAIRSATDIRAITIKFLKDYEKPKGQNDPKEWDKRTSFAEQILNICENLNPDSGDYINITPRIYSLKKGENVDIVVSSSDDFSFEIMGQGVSAVKTDRLLSVSCETSEKKVVVISIFLQKNRNVITTFSALLNGEEEVERVLEVTPDKVNMYSNQKITFLVRSSEQFDVRLGFGLILLEKNENSVTIQTIAGDSAYNTSVTFFYKNDIEKKNIITVRVLGGGLPPIKKGNGANWLYYINNMLKGGNIWT